MSTTSTDGKQFANLAYYSAVVSGLAMGYAALVVRFTMSINYISFKIMVD